MQRWVHIDPMFFAYFLSAALVIRGVRCVLVAKSEESFVSANQVLNEMIVLKEIKHSSDPTFVKEREWEDLVIESFREKMVTIIEKVRYKKY